MLPFDDVDNDNDDNDSDNDNDNDNEFNNIDNYNNSHYEYEYATLNRCVACQTFQAITRCRQEIFTLRSQRPPRCRPATGSFNLFSAQLAASVALSVLVLYGHISAAKTQCKRHYSGSVVAETLCIHWCHIKGCCNNPNGMSLQNLSYFQSWVCHGSFESLRQKSVWV